MNTPSLPHAEQIALLNGKARQAMELACRAVETEGFRGFPRSYAVMQYLR